MNKLMTIVTAMTLAAVPVLAHAVGSPTAAPASATSVSAAKNQAKLEQELEQARAKLQEDVRRVSELSMQLNGPSMQRFYYINENDQGAEQHGFLGVDLADVQTGSSQAGAQLSGVTPDGPAAKAGLKTGDVITSINGTRFNASGDISAVEKLVQYMRGVKPGQTLELTYTRDGKPGSVKVVAGEVADNLTDMVNIPMPAFMHRAGVGIIIDSMASANGVQIVGVTPGGPADKAGLRTGDVITAINGTTLKSREGENSNDTLREFMDTVHPGDKLKVTYSRGSKTEVATVTAEIPGDIAFHFRIPALSKMSPIPPAPPIMMGGYAMFLDSGQWADVQLVPMSPGLGRYFGTDKGLLVLHTPGDSVLQLQDGDVILKIGSRDPGTPPHAMRILGSYGPGETVPLTIMRKGKQLTLNVKLPKDKNMDMNFDTSELYHSLNSDLDMLSSAVN